VDVVDVGVEDSDLAADAVDPPSDLLSVLLSLLLSPLLSADDSAFPLLFPEAAVSPPDLPFCA
jgi:hypothetical protein